MTDQSNVQQQNVVEEKPHVNNVNVGNVPNAGTPVGSERPTFLTVLCILTFIGSGLAIIGGLLSTVLSGALELLGGQIPSPFDMLVPETGLFVGIVLLLAAVASLVGAIKMWKLQKLGFMIYAAAQVVALVLGFGVMSLIFTGLFIGLYYMNLKHLK